MIITEYSLRKLIRNILSESDEVFSDTYREVVADHNDASPENNSNERPENDISNTENSNNQEDIEFYTNLLNRNDATNYELFRQLRSQALKKSKRG